MKKDKIKSKKKKIIIISIIIILLLIVIGNIFLHKDNNETRIETETIEKRDIAKSIGATGTITTSDTKNVMSTLTGSKITSVKVKVGDKISVGDVICTFDTSTIEDNLASLQKTKNVAAAQSNLGIQSAKRNLNDAISNKDTQIVASQADIDKALKAYQDADAKLKNAQADLNNKKNSLNSYTVTYNNATNSFNKVKTEYDKREKDYNDITNSYNAQKALLANSEAQYNIYFKINGGVISQIDPATGLVIDPSNYQCGNYATEIHKQVSETYESAKSNVAGLENSLNIAKSNYLNYKTTYDSALATYTPVSEQYKTLSSNVANAQSTVSSLGNTVSTLKNTYDSTVKAHNTAVSQSNSSISSMQDALANSELGASVSTETQDSQIRAYQKQLEEGNLKSTVSGTVTAVNVKNGDIYTGNTIAVIEGCEEFIVETEIDEYDIADVKEGMNVLIKTDATRDEELKGRVIYTAPSATTINSSAGALGMSTGVSASNSNATYTVKIALDTPNDRLRLGMNAKLSIIVENKENVWTVPYDAVYEREDGSNYIEILKNEETNEIEELDVKKGLEGSYYIEIISDKLKENMKVVLPEVDAGSSIEALIDAMGPAAGI